VLGHESLGHVIDPGPRGGFAKGDLVVGIVGWPDPLPCPNCAVGEWDIYRNGQYTERGIKEIDGFMSERWRIEPEFTWPLAQPGDLNDGIHEVAGSIPASSTNPDNKLARRPEIRAVSS
jgi:threonine dehydrogenase-like Zn-dependent dehydrogenase